jgi:hypothetical protein
LQSQQVIEHWIQLYNCLTGGCYRVTTRSYTEPYETNAGVVCADGAGNLIALEHALVGIRNEEPGARCLTVRDLLEHGLLKLSGANADKRILLLESDSVSGAIDERYACVRDDARVKSLRRDVDEVWVAYTALLDSENVIFTNRIDPEDNDDCSLCSLNVNTGEFWRLRG